MLQGHSIKEAADKQSNSSSTPKTLGLGAPSKKRAVVRLGFGALQLFSFCLWLPTLFFFFLNLDLCFPAKIVL